jgi:hypothetical protein
MQLLAKMESGKIHADELLSVRGGRGAFAAAKITECFVSRKRKGTGPLEESHMRLIFGVIIGCLLTIGGASAMNIRCGRKTSMAQPIKVRKADEN